MVIMTSMRVKPREPAFRPVGTVLGLEIDPGHVTDGEVLEVVAGVLDAPHFAHGHHRQGALGGQIVHLVKIDLSRGVVGGEVDPLRLVSQGVAVPGGIEDDAELLVLGDGARPGEGDFVGQGKGVVVQPELRHDTHHARQGKSRHDAGDGQRDAHLHEGHAPLIPDEPASHYLILLFFGKACCMPVQKARSVPHLHSPWFHLLTCCF
jgi:hypothetical protein